MDAGRAYNGGRPPHRSAMAIRTYLTSARTILRRLFSELNKKPGSLSNCETSTATWKIWGNTTGTLDFRADPLNLPAGLTKPWPGAGYGVQTAAITAPHILSAVKFTISFGHTESGRLPPARAIGTVSGRGWLPNRFLRSDSNPSGSRLSSAPSPPPDLSKLWSTTFQRTIRYARCF